MARTKCNKGFVEIVCVLMFLVGAVIFAAGVNLRVSTGFFGNEAVALFNKIRQDKIEFGRMMLTHMYGMIAVGGGVMFKSVLGIGGTVKRSKCVLRLFIGLIIVLIIAQAVHVGLWVNTRSRVGEGLLGEMMILLEDYQGPQHTDDISDGWNKLFMQGRCCGLADQFVNGDTTSDFQDTSSIWFNTNKLPTETIPATCCIGTDEKDISSQINSSCTTTPKEYYTKGCYSKLEEYISLYSVLYISAVSSLAVLQLLATFSSCTLMDPDDNRIFPMSTQNNPPIYVKGDYAVKTKFGLGKKQDFTQKL